MRDLGLIAMFVVLSVTMSGPFNIGLSSQVARRLTYENAFLNIARRGIMGFIAILGTLVSINFAYNDAPLLPKVMAIISFCGNVWSIKREYRTPLELDKKAIEK